MEEKNIPKIKFKDKLKMEFEILKIADIFKRYEKGDFKYEIQKFHRIQFNMILLVENDHSKHFIDFTSYDLHKNDILFVGENHVHAFSLNYPINGTVILFTSDFFRINQSGENISLLKELFKIPIINNLGENKIIRDLVNILVIEYKENKNYFSKFYKHVLLSIILKIYFELNKNYKNKPEKKYRQTIEKLDELIETSLYRCRDSTIYAKTMGYSYKQLNIICRNITGSTLKQYIDNTISLEMKRQIVASKMSLKELCLFFDFDEETNLIKYFKKQSGLSPKKFREQYDNFNI